MPRPGPARPRPAMQEPPRPGRRGQSHLATSPPLLSPPPGPGSRHKVVACSPGRWSGSDSDISPGPGARPVPDTDFLDRMLRIGRHPGRETRAAFGLGDSDGIRAGRAPAGALRVAGAIPLPGDGAASSGVDSSCGQRGPGAQRRGRGVLRGPGPRRPGARAFVPAGRQGSAGGVNGRRRPPAPSLRGSAARAWPPGHASVQERTPSGLEERTRNRSPATTSPSHSAGITSPSPSLSPTGRSRRRASTFLIRVCPGLTPKFDPD